MKNYQELNLIFEQVNQASCWNVDLKINKNLIISVFSLGLKYEDILSPEWGGGCNKMEIGVYPFSISTSLL